MFDRLRTLRFAPARTAHAWFDGDAGAGTRAAVADPPAGGATPPATGDPAPADPPKGSDEVHALRTKAGRLEAELAKLKEAEAKRAEADLSEVDRLKKQLAERDSAIEATAAQVKAVRLSGAALAAAARLGFADPEDAQRFLDADMVDWADDGTPTNVGALLEAVLKTKPYLKASFTQPPDLGQGARGKAGAPLTREAIAKMTPGEINARWDEVQEVMKRG